MGAKFYNPTKRIVITRGDTGRGKLTLSMDGIPYEMQEGDEIHVGVKRDYSDQECLIRKIYTENPFVLHIEPQDTKSLDFGTYVWDAELVRANGDTYTFVVKKEFVVTEEVV